MVIIVSARECCGDQPSSSLERDRAGKETPKAKHAAYQVFRKFSEMPDFPSPWRGLVLHSSIHIKQN
jgi:hypothetical protein